GNAKPSSAIRQGNWKLIEFFETGKPELYDLYSDPSESKDLSVANTEKTDLLLKTLHDWQKETGATIPSGPNPHYDPNAKKRPREDR
ncbi:MAG: aryl-sulfate sulfohydrolase, partial [Actinobacteria bacterium]|nr:aryl-sulfate sulfohydrolase [Actinomycetota bacterium]